MAQMRQKARRTLIELGTRLDRANGIAVCAGRMTAGESRCGGVSFPVIGEKINTGTIVGARKSIYFSGRFSPGVPGKDSSSRSVGMLGERLYEDDCLYIEPPPRQ